MNEKTYTIGEICEALKCEQHNIRYIEKTLDLKIERDEFLNRVYYQHDLDKFKMIFQLKEQGLNYAAIKKVLEQQEEIVTDVVEEVRQDIVLQNKNLDSLIEMLTEKITHNIETSVGARLEALTKEVETITKHNNELQHQLKQQQEEHFKKIDDKLVHWREETEKNNNKTWLQKLLGK